jgi:hypothetical protein
MSDMDILSELILQSVLVPLVINEYGKPVIKLQESGVKDSVSFISNIPSDAIVIKADKFPAPKTFFKGDKGECKRADFIIISEEKKVILYVELKAGAKDRGHIVKQLKGASCVISYCKEIGKQFWSEPRFLDGYAHRYIGMVNLSISKKTSRHESAPLHDSPESFLKISSPHHLQFNQLASV